MEIMKFMLNYFVAYKSVYPLSFSLCRKYLFPTCWVQSSFCPSQPSPLHLLHPHPPTSAATVTMTTGGCCHLPGSLCDCASSTGLWKNVEEAGGGDGCQALYVTQVTAIDGRLLSSVLKPMSTQRCDLLMLSGKKSLTDKKCLAHSSAWKNCPNMCNPSQWWPHLPYLPRRRQQRGPPVSVRLHRHPRHGAQELLGEVAVVFQHQLLRALPHRVQHRAPTEASHRGNKGQCPLPCLHQSFCLCFFCLFSVVCEGLWGVAFLHLIFLLACLLACCYCVSCLFLIGLKISLPPVSTSPLPLFACPPPPLYCCLPFFFSSVAAGPRPS